MTSSECKPQTGVDAGPNGGGRVTRWWRLPSLPRPVWMLSWTSLFTDTASEAVYPLMPLFLVRAIGASALSIGVIEGAAEAVNSVLRIVSGQLSDRWRARKPFVLAGYTLSSVVRPLVAFATAWPQVFAVRLMDRVGKGIRGAPRDAMLAAYADPASRGYVFGLHRAMDHAGAVVGPLLASLFLWFSPEDYRTLFMLTVIPGAIAVLMLVPIKDAGAGAGAVGHAPVAPAARVPLGGTFYRYLGVLLVFALGNSTDAYLLLKLSDAGVASVWIPALWAALHVVKAGASPFGGLLADRFERRYVIMAGWLLYAAVYFAFARVTSLPSLIAVFLTYGLFYALTEGGEKAIVADLSPADAHGLAFGWYNGVVGIGALTASLVFGLIWKQWGAPAAFYTGAGLALLAAGLLGRIGIPHRAPGARGL
jgi:MFS family permease